jgi:type II secretory pathway pseudopilin PulG
MIELLIALAIFAVGVLSLAAIIPSGARRSDSAGQQSRASEFAAAEAEELLDTNYSDGSLSVGSHDDPDNPRLQQYYVQWNVEGDQPITNCKRVTITVRRSSTLAPVIARLVILKPLAEG